VVAFLGSGSDGRVGLYSMARGGPLAKLVQPDDTLDGAPVLAVDFGSEGLAGGRIAFSATLDRGTDPVFGPQTQSFVFVPEADALAGGVVCWTALFALRRSRATGRRS